jgi:flavoprotein
MDETLIKRMIASIKCGSCGQNYQEDDIEVVEHNDELWFLKVSCSSCHVRCLVAAIIRENARPEVITDLTDEEVEKFKNLDGVRDEDLLAMHNFLKDFDGDFPRVFDQE